VLQLHLVVKILLLVIMNFFIQEEVILINFTMVIITNLITIRADFVLSFVKLINLANLKELKEVELTIKEGVIIILAIIFMVISNKVIR